MQHCSNQNVTAKPLHSFCSTAANLLQCHCTLVAELLQHLCSATATHLQRHCKTTCSSRKIRLEIEPETYFQTKFRTVVINVPVSGRLNGYRTCQEKRITGSRPKENLVSSKSCPQSQRSTLTSAPRYTPILSK